MIHKQLLLIYNWLIVGCSLEIEGMGVCKEKNDLWWHATGCSPNMFSEQAQWSWFPKKPTSNKHSTSECLKGKSSLVWATASVFTNICRFSLMRPKILLCTSHGKGCAEIGMKQHSGQTRFPKMAADSILMSQKDLSLTRGALGLVFKEAFTWKQTFNWWILKQHLQHHEQI